MWSESHLPPDFYVYRHLTPSGQVFYVGKGKGDRAWSTWRSDYWHNVVRESGGFRVHIIEYGLQEWYALELEAVLISYYGQRVSGDGNLVNLTSGGEGSTHCEETKAKLSAICKQQFADPVKRKVHSEAVKVANAKPEYRLKQRNAKLGKKLSREHVDKVSAAMRASKCRPITCVQTGAHFATSYEAMNWLRMNGKPRATGIKVLAVCHGVRRSAYGYTWQFIQPHNQGIDMESRLMALVKAMHQKFGLENTEGPSHLPAEEKAFRIAALQEELNEYAEADDLVKQYDALLDLIVFAVGTLERHGFPLLPGFTAVMSKNMQKEVGQNGNKRGGFKRDLVKPPGWTGPEDELARILLEAYKQAELPLDNTAVAPSSDGTITPGFAPKFDAHKVRVDLLPVYPMTAIAEVFTFGAQKYFADSYRQGETVAWSRTYGSILRHLFAFWDGEDIDSESGKSHLAHAGTQLMILMEHTKHNRNKDDRFKREAA